jgi:hypothetical protein
VGGVNRVGPVPENLEGRRFGNTVAVSYELRPEGNHRRGGWLCQCDCGREHWVRRMDLVNNRVSRCDDCGVRKKTRHGASLRGRKEWPEYRIWTQMKQRCQNPKSRKYKDYGARGIIVCQRWQYFDAFIADMGRRPRPDYSLDRIDNEGPYSPENCRWADKKTQSRNQRPRLSVNTSHFMLGVLSWGA